MDTALFSDRSVTTMLHGIVLGGGALLGLGAALWTLLSVPAGEAGATAPDVQARRLGWLLAGTAAVLWLTVIVGTYVSFPPYRATPPDGATDLAAYPRSLLLADPATAWLHGFAMEIKEHTPWIAAMLATAVAYVAVRERRLLATEAPLRRATATLVAACFAIVSFVSLLGVLVNKVAPLE